MLHDAFDMADVPKIRLIERLFHSDFHAQILTLHSLPHTLYVTTPYEGINYFSSTLSLSVALSIRFSSFTQVSHNLELLGSIRNVRNNLDQTKQKK